MNNLEKIENLKDIELLFLDFKPEGWKWQDWINQAKSSKVLTLSPEFLALEDLDTQIV